MFTAALFTLAKMWKQPKGPSTDEWIMKISHTHIHTDIIQLLKIENLPFSIT